MTNYLEECHHYRFYAEFPIKIPEDVVERLQAELDDVVCKPIMDGTVHITYAKIGNTDNGGYIDIVIHILKDVPANGPNGMLSGIFGGHGLSPNFTISEVTPPEPSFTEIPIIPIAIGIGCLIIFYKFM